MLGGSEVPYSVADPTTSSNLYDDAILILCATSAPDNTGQGENPLKSPCPEPVWLGDVTLLQKNFGPALLSFEL